MTQRQYLHATPIILDVGDSVMKRSPERSCKLAPSCSQGSVNILVCVDHFSRFVVLAPLRNKYAGTIAHAIMSHVICPYTTPRVLLSDNGTEFKNQILADICSQYNIKQT